MFCETEHEKFLNKCTERGCYSADLLRDIVMDFLNGGDKPKIDNSKEPVRTIEVDLSGSDEAKPIAKAKEVKVEWLE